MAKPPFFCSRHPAGDAKCERGLCAPNGSKRSPPPTFVSRSETATEDGGFSFEPEPQSRWPNRSSSVAVALRATRNVRGAFVPRTGQRGRRLPRSFRTAKRLQKTALSRSSLSLRVDGQTALFLPTAASYPGKDNNCVTFQKWRAPNGW